MLQNGRKPSKTFCFRVCRKRFLFFEMFDKLLKQFTIQMFGVDENGKSASIIVKNFMPFFYVKIKIIYVCVNTLFFLYYILCFYMF